MHVECNRDKIKENADRLSRHWFDLVMLSRHHSGQLAINNRSLFEDVVRHKKVFFSAGYANYDMCLDSQLKLLPGDDSIQALQMDYEKMIDAGMIYQVPPEFYNIVESIRQIEKDINAW